MSADRTTLGSPSGAGGWVIVDPSFTSISVYAADGTLIATISNSLHSPLTGVGLDFGIGLDGVPYYDPLGVDTGRAANIFVDSTGQPYLVLASGGAAIPIANSSDWTWPPGGGGGGGGGPTPVSNVILFGADSVYYITPDGNTLTPISTFLLANNGPWKWLRWKPDGTRFVAVNGRNEVWLFDSDGDNGTQLTNLDSTAPLSQACGSWSPDGTKLALVYGSGGTGIQLVNVDNSGFTHFALANYAWGSGNTCWSPDGTKLLFTGATAVNTPGAGDICTVGISGSSRTVVLAATTSVGYSAWAWYADNSNVLATAEGGLPSFPIDVIKTNGTVTSTLYHDATEAWVGDYPMDLSPDESKVAFIDNQHLTSKGLAVLSAGTPAEIFSGTGVSSFQGISWAR